MARAVLADTEASSPAPARPALVPAPQRPSTREALHHAALTVNSSLRLDEVLARLAGLVLEAVPADRCAVFLIDDKERLVPAYAIGRQANEALWQHFIRLDPIELRGHPGRWEAFTRNRPFYLPDLAASPLVPAELTEFGAGSALLMPLEAMGKPVGLLSADWSIPRARCPEQEAAVIEGIGAYAALAIRNARLFDGAAAKTRVLERLVEVSEALNSAAGLGAVLDLVCDSYREILGAANCSVVLLDDTDATGLRVAAQRGAKWPATSRGGGVTSFLKNLQAEGRLGSPNGEPVLCPELARARPPGPSSVTGAAVFSLRHQQKALGFVVAGFHAKRQPAAEELDAARALGDLAATAVVRSRLHRDLEARLRRMEVMSHFSDVIFGATELPRALRKLHRMLPSHLGVTLESIALTDPQLRETVGAKEPDAEELEAVRSWRSRLGHGSTSLGPRSSSRGLLVPIVHHQRVLGALRVSHTSDYSVDEHMLLTIAGGCAKVIHRAGLQQELAESERRLTITSERERIGRDLHDSAAQVLMGLGMMLDEYAHEAPSSLWSERLEDLREQAARGSREIRAAIHSLMFLQVHKRGLTRSVRELVRKFKASTGIDVTFSVAGEAQHLVPPAEDALFRVAHEGLVNVERHSQAHTAAVSLSYGEETATLSVTDNGVGLRGRDPFYRRAGHFGLPGLSRSLEGLGGSLNVYSLIPTGLRVEGWVPVRPASRRKTC